MKTSIVLLIFVLFIGTFFLIDSEALIVPPAPRSDPSITEISIQMVLRNSDGMLVDYREPTMIYLNNVYLLHQFLDAQEKKTIINKDGNNYEQIEFEYQHISRVGGLQKASYSLSWEGFSVLTTRYDGYISEIGDTFEISWKIVRII